MATGLVVVEFVWHYSIADPRMPPTMCKRYRDIFYTSGVIAFLSQISLPWQRGLVVLQFVWRHSIARPRQPPVGCKQLRDISYTSRAVADFVPNFVAMATGVGRGRTCLASFNSPTPKTPCYTQRSSRYLLYMASYSRFCAKFCCHGNRGHPGVNLNDTVK